MMKRARSWGLAVAVAVAFGSCLCVQARAAEAGCDWLGNGDTTASKIVSPPAQDIEYSPYGYSFPYVLYVPAKPLTKGFPYLIVEPNNNPDDAGLSAKEQLARVVITARMDYASLGHVLADTFEAPLLMPVFPRPLTDDRTIDLDTHSLTREAMLVASGPLYRVDLQLIAMAAETREQLARCGLKLADKFVIEGFSASGVFTNRFVMLHPDRVAAAAYGGTCGFLMLPVSERDGFTLNYPLGTADYERFAGKSFDRQAFDSVPQFAYAGARDTDPDRDCVGKPDSFSDDDSAIIRRLVGGDVPDRWLKTKALFHSLGSGVQIERYPELAHAWYDDSHSVICDVIRVFGELAKQGPPACVKKSSK